LPKEQQEAQRQETNRRHAKKKTKVLNAQMQAARYYRRYVTQMVESAVTESAKDEVYRNQIRLRKYLYQIKKGMPYIGEKNKEKLKQSVVDLLVAGRCIQWAWAQARAGAGAGAGGRGRGQKEAMPSRPWTPAAG
jgi:hypothetical protein